MTRIKNSLSKKFSYLKNGNVEYTIIVTINIYNININNLDIKLIVQ